jgi:hypothetical protein
MSVASKWVPDSAVSYALQNKKLPHKKEAKNFTKFSYFGVMSHLFARKAR